uniref:Spermidine synthase n=1 Tax=uncultured prokaryote TaxID=198431 RepID=H5SPK5_9ZZZZ|nr:spermidine synthase [uncultured prokaryote]
MVEFGEPATAGFWYRYEGEHLHSERSPYQQIDVYETSAFGRVLVLDGLLQTTEADEFCYHEMLVHVPMLSVEAPRRVLIIGGGDGGSLRHVLMHPSVERAVMCEIDERVVAASRRWLPSVSAGAFDDPRATLVFDDGASFVASSSEQWDVVIVDSSDPVGPGVVLFRHPFYRSVSERLAPGGVLAVQACSPFFQPAELHAAVTNLRAAFPDVRLYLGAVPTYPGTLWAFALAGRSLVVDAETARRRAAERRLRTRFWTPELHASAFALPAFVQAILAGQYPSFANHADAAKS